jgi:(2Fe-2S) ferredoxin
MQPAGKHYSQLILVCTNQRDNGRECCADKGSPLLFEKIKGAVAALNPKVRVSRTGCLGNCETGITVVIMPDDLWFGRVTEADIPKILEHVRGAAAVKDSDADFLFS